MSLSTTLFLCFVIAVIGAGIRSVIRQRRLRIQDDYSNLSDAL